MNDVQAAARKRADASMAPALELYAERCKLATVYYRLKLDDLRRLNALIAKLSDSELRRVAAFAEGLAEWGEDEPSSPDASSSDRKTTGEAAQASAPCGPGGIR